jgi:hypothetical protein
MARYIFKYGVRIDDVPTQHLLDEGAEILSVGIQYDPSWLEEVVVFWAFCEDGVPNGKPRTFKVIGTGHEAPEDAVYHGTVQQPPFVWHLVEVPTKEEI